MSQLTLHPEIAALTEAHLPIEVAAPMPHAQADLPAQTAPIEELLRRMQAGDRAAAATFLLRYEARIRRRVRSKLLPDVRRLFDSLDILSTLGRRLDGYVLSGHLRAENEIECLHLLFKMADNALIDKVRLVRLLESTEGEDSEFAQLMAARLRDAMRDAGASLHIEIEKCMRALPDPLDRRILSLWLTGEQHKNIALKMDVPACRIRKRWEDITGILRERFPAPVA